MVQCASLIAPYSLLPPDFTVPEPTDSAALMADELPLDAGEEEGPPTLFDGPPDGGEGPDAA